MSPQIQERIELLRKRLRELGVDLHALGLDLTVSRLGESAQCLREAESHVHFAHESLGMGLAHAGAA